MNRVMTAEHAFVNMDKIVAVYVKAIREEMSKGTDIQEALNIIDARIRDNMTAAADVLGAIMTGQAIGQ